MKTAPESNMTTQREATASMITTLTNHPLRTLQRQTQIGGHSRGAKEKKEQKETEKKEMYSQVPLPPKPPFLGSPVFFGHIFNASGGIRKKSGKTWNHKNQKQGASSV